MIKTKTLYLVLVVIFYILPFGVEAQEESALNAVSATITNKSGDALEGVHILASKSRNRAVTNENGSFSIKVQVKDILVLTRLGYERMVVYIDNGSLESESIVLKQWGVIEPQEDTNIALGSMPFERITGSVERITGEELNDFPTAFTREALAGRLSGLQTSYNNGSTVAESFGNSIRGQGVGQLFVDGIPSVDIVLTPAEIDDVVIAKDYGSSFMYGTLGAPGAIIVNTKHGLPGGRLFRFKSRTGVRTPTFLPNTMNAQDYARNYNIALSNDGLSPIYTQSDIDDYTNGTNPVMNPNNDYYEDFANGISTYTHLTGDFSGGNEDVQYFSHLGYYTTDGIENVGEGRKLTRLRLNNNVQIKFGNTGHVNVGIGGSFNKRNEPRLNANSAFNTMYNYPANAIPYKINDTIFGRTQEFGTNLLVDLANGNIMEDERRDAFARIGLDLDLSEVTEGLTLKGLVGMYTLNVLSSFLDLRPHTAEPVFTPNGDGTYETSFREFSPEKISFNFSKLGDRVDRSQYIQANLHYNRDFSKNHKVIADVFFTNQKLTGSQLQQNTIYRNIGLRANYLLNEKYVLEGKLLNSPIRQLSQDERDKINYDAGIAWLLHKESFLDSADWLNFLKFRANFGVQSRPVSQFFISEHQYGSSGAGTFGVFRGETAGAGGSNRVFTASDLVTPKQEYLSVGLDFQMFNSKVNGQLNYFNIRNYDQITVASNLYAIIPSNYTPLMSYGDSRRRGVDANISYNNKIGDFAYKLGVNAMYNVSYNTLSNSITYPRGEEQRNAIGNQGGRIIGLQAAGIFQNDAEIASATPQLFGEVKPGDIRYVDFNNDGVIDEKDYHEVGKSPRVSFGLNYMMQYKNWSFSIHGDGVLGGKYVEQLNWNRGINDYTQELANSWPVSNSLPRLTTLSNSNNYRTSSFWLKDASYFNVRSIMVAYSLPQNLLKDIGVKEFSLSGSVKNPFVISSNKERFMPSRNKGYSEHPVLKAFELGIQVSF
ncbi:SusC/RagA family TonB-linked outer membrane protein [Flavivirga algicola]|uniref:SusC/RagA family TonB-linked outer membrane protein n=1 Tax=Flavivirga algicola TaxID=2729136 RepID=A0ABX1S3A7_9FLAO|nr:SusC/RagA family TonB-linked outer membrane protein [Flavivirga algicola]NMH89856.1 SusC/RagA family TonB-linked outer membrane protein [Flavivirga algicola]